MSNVQHGANTITIAGLTLLLTCTRSGQAIHLAAEHEGPGVGRPAVDELYFGEHADSAQTLSNYHHGALVAPRWADVTLCGHIWAIMVGGDGGPVIHDDLVGWAPSCRSCITVVSRNLDKPPEDERISVVSQITADLVINHGYAEVVGVPGDQQDALRKAIRKQLRDAGYRSQTFARDTTVYVTSEEIYEKYADTYDQQAALASSWHLKGATEQLQPNLPDCTVSWAAWDIG